MYIYNVRVPFAYSFSAIKPVNVAIHESIEYIRRESGSIYLYQPFGLIGYLHLSFSNKEPRKVALPAIDCRVGVNGRADNILHLPMRRVQIMYIWYLHGIYNGNDGLSTSTAGLWAIYGCNLDKWEIRAMHFGSQIHSRWCALAIQPNFASIYCEFFSYTTPSIASICITDVVRGWYRFNKDDMIAAQHQTVASGMISTHHTFLCDSGRLLFTHLLLISSYIDSCAK